jgi:hypothetical protein
MKNKRIRLIDIFSKYIKNNYKIISFKPRNTKVGTTRYFPPVSKE